MNDIGPVATNTVEITSVLPRHLRFLAAAIVSCFLVAAHAQEGGGAKSMREYSSVGEAVDAFEKSSDVDVRTGAYEWMKKAALGSKSEKVREPLVKGTSMALKLGKSDDFQALCAEVIKNGDAEAISTAVTVLSDFLGYVGEHGKAVEVITPYLGADSPVSPANRIALASKAASILSSKLNRLSDAVAVLEDAISGLPADDAKSFTSLANQQAGILFNLSELDRAEAMASRVIALGDACPVAEYSASSVLLCSIARARGDTQSAVSAIMRALEKPLVPNTGFARHLIDAGVARADLERAVELLRKQVAFYIVAGDLRQLPGGVDRAQNEIVELLLSMGKREEAAGECRVLLFCATPQSYKPAVELSAKTIKALDGNLGRANAFLEFQSAGQENLSEHVNVLMGIQQLRDQERLDCAEQLSSSPKPASWNGWLNRAVAYLWLDRPAESMDCALEAFASCPFAEAPLQSCADAVVKPFLVARRDETAARNAIDFLVFGDAGRDGVRGTADDVKDPFPVMREKLAYGSDGAAAAQPTVASGVQNDVPAPK